MALTPSNRTANPINGERYTIPSEHEWPKKSRFWVFTVNNPTAACYDFVEECYLNGSCRYLCFAKENFDTVGKTPHLQGYVEFTTPVSFAKLRTLIPRAYVARKRGTRQQARAYCQKDVGNDFREYGTYVKDRSGERNDMEAVRKRIRDGATMNDISNEFFSLWCRYSSHFSLYQSQIIKKQRREDILSSTITPTVIKWFYGPTGSGKTRAAKLELATLGEFFEKVPGGKWFDGYAGEKYALFDDFRPSWFDWSLLLRITDPYAGYTNVEVKNAITPFRPSLIIFTSPIHPKDLYTFLSEKEDFGQMMRRLELTSFPRSNANV